MDGPIASAVVLPEELQAPASPPSKRRNSSISEDNAKRRRLGGQDSNEGHFKATDAKPAAPVRRERGRERRLFGAVLGALSQNTATAGQKRRAEIEKRQQVIRQSETEGSDQRKAERIAKRKEQRWIEQKHFEKDLIRTRHAALLNMARFLQTETEPHLYYKPWETTPEEDDRIQHQIAVAEDIIKREVEEYDARQRQESHTDRLVSDRPILDKEESYIGKNQSADILQDLSTVNVGTNGSTNSPTDLEMKDDHVDDTEVEATRDEHVTETVPAGSILSHETTADDTSKDNDDDNGEDVIEEAAEDTVIY